MESNKGRKAQNPILKKLKDVFSVKMKNPPDSELQNLNREPESEHRKLQNKTHLLEERNKELSLLYQIFCLVTRENISEDKFLQELVNLIPPAWQYPEVACARIIFRNRTYQTFGFIETIWRMAAEIRVNKKLEGKMEVFYLKKMPEEAEGPFLSDEKILLNTVAIETGLYLERKSALIKLQNNKENLQIILNAIGDGVWDWNLQTGGLFFSDHWKRMLGYEPQEIKNELKEWESRVHPEDKESIKKDIDNCISGHSSAFLNEYRMCCKDGTYKWILGRGKIMSRNEAGSPLRFVGTHADISERKKTEKALHNSERLLASIIGNLPGFVYRCKYDKDWTMLYLSQQFEKITGYPTTDILHNAKRTYNDLIKKDFQSEIFKKWEEAIAEKSVFEAEYPILTRDNQLRWIWERGIGVFDATGNLMFLEGYIEDLTQRKQSEEKLKESEERFRLVMENSLDAILITNPDGSILNANKAACEMFQMTREEIRKAGRNGVVNLDDPNFPKLLEERKKKGYTAGELTFFRKDGSLFPVDITSSVFTNSKGEIRTSMIIRDISDRKQVEEKLKNSDRIFEHSVDMMAVAGFDGYLKVINPAWERTLGWTREELLSRSWDYFLHPDDVERTHAIKTEIIDGRKAYRFENRYRCKDGAYKWLSWNAFPYPKENVMFTVVRDITQSKLAGEEMQRLKENLEVEVEQKTRELRERVAELERFQNATIEREFRLKELRNEINLLKKVKSKNH